LASDIEKEKLRFEEVKWGTRVLHSIIRFFLHKWTMRAAGIAISASLGAGAVHYYPEAKPAEITPQKATNTVKKNVPRETIIKEKVDYSKVQEMINKALQDHLREYHQ